MLNCGAKTMDRLAVVMPTYTIRPALEDMAVANAKIWREQCDDLIITEDGGVQSPALRYLSSFYLYHQNVGVCNSMRLAWLVALIRRADYVFITDSDVTLEHGSLRDLCVPGRVTVPRINQHPDTAFTAPCLCVPRTVSNERGIYPESIDGFHRDDGFDAAYAQQIHDLVMKINTVRVNHIGGATRHGNV